MKRMTNLVLVGLVLTAALLRAQEGTAANDEAIHNELRALRDRMRPIVAELNVEEVLKVLHEDVVFTPMNAEVCRGPEAVRAFFDRMMSGPDRVVESVSIEFTVDALTVLYGGDSGVKDTGVAYGDSNSHYKLTNGLEFDVENKWTSTLVKEGGEWRIASLHACANIFDNPLLSRVEGLVYSVGGIAVVAGLIVGAILARVLRRKAG